MVVEKGNDILEGTLKESLNVTSGCFWRFADHSVQSSLQVSQPLMRVMKTVTGLHDRIFITCLLFSFENDSAFLYPRQASVQSCYCLCEWLVAILLRLKTCVKPTYRLAREAGRWCNNHFVHLYFSESLLSRCCFFRFEIDAELPTGTCCTTLCRWYTKRPLKFFSLLKSCSSSCLASFPKITFISLPCLLLMWSLLRTLHELKIFCIGPTFCILPNIPISMLYSFKLLVIRTYVISSVTQRTNLNQYIH